MDKIKVVLMGGGTGLSVLARGLKEYKIDISAIVTVADDGGSTGRIRSEIDMPAPGDIRNVLAALSDTEELIEDLFTYRFKETAVSGHSLGNLMIAAMYDLKGDFSTAIHALSGILNVKGAVIPSTNHSPKLAALMKDHSIYIGESYIPTVDKPIKEMFLLPSGLHGAPAAIEAIEQADFIIFGPGSLYTSIIPNVLPTGIKQALKKTNAHSIFINNIMEQPGETVGMSASDCLQALHWHIGKDIISHMIISDADLKDVDITHYKKEGASIVKADRESILASGIEVLTYSNIVKETSRGMLRHDTKQLSQHVYELLLDLFDSTIEY